MQSGYTILEHPADLGIEARGKTLAEAFEQAAIGMMSVILELSDVECRESQNIELHADDLEQLLVRWLGEILYRYDGQKFVSKECTIQHLTASGLKAVVRGEYFSSKNHHTKLDVKAITYHQLLIQEAKGEGFVRFFLDI